MVLNQVVEDEPLLWRQVGAHHVCKEPAFGGEVAINPPNEVA
jgi:hypothetical protein